VKYYTHKWFVSYTLSRMSIVGNLCGLDLLYVRLNIYTQCIMLFDDEGKLHWVALRVLDI
jgi:hypothetical protein